MNAEVKAEDGPSCSPAAARLLPPAFRLGRLTPRPSGPSEALEAVPLAGIYYGKRKRLNFPHRHESHCLKKSESECACAHVCMCAGMCMHACVCVRAYVCVYVCVSVCVYMHV